MDELKIQRIEIMDKIDAYKQEEQNRDLYGSLILDEKTKLGPDVSLVKVALNKYESILYRPEIEEIHGAQKKVKERINSQKKMIKDHESDKVDLMELTNQNPYLIAEWLRASAVAHDSSKSFTAVVVAMDYLLNCNADERTEAALVLKK